MAIDRFPTTHRTWLHERLSVSEAADVDVLQHVMARYVEPLQAYAMGSSLRAICDPGELVNGFFAASLADPTYLRRWLESGQPLRRWLMNGLILHAKGVRRDAGREAARRERVADARDGVAVEPDVEAAFEFAWARRMLEVAVDSARETSTERGKQRAFELFRRHVIDGLPYRQAVVDLGYSASEAKGVIRGITRIVRDALLQGLREEGIPEVDLASEAVRLQRLLER